MEFNALDDPLYSSTQVARAAGISERVMKAWLARGVLKLDEASIESEGTGKPRRFTLRRALVVGAMAKLVEAGLQPSEAASAAERWTHFGRGPLPGQGGARMPATLYGNGSFTVLRRFPGGYADVVEAKRSTPATDLFIHPQSQKLSPGLVCIMLDFVDKQIRVALGTNGTADRASPRVQAETAGE